MTLGVAKSKSFHNLGIRTKLYDRLLRARVADKAFTIISNNCWGSDIYKACKMPYLTPFIGLFVGPECYLKMLHDFRRTIRAELKFKQDSRYEWANELRKSYGSYPIGQIGDGVEIHFQHYPSAEEARVKWQRRVDRVVGDDARLFVKFCDRNPVSDEQLRHFDALPMPHKVCFVSRPQPTLGTMVHVPGFEAEGHVPDGPTLYRKCRRYFDVAAWLNGQAARPAFWYRTCTRSVGI